MNKQSAVAALEEEIHRIAPEVDLATVDRGADLREELDIDSMDFLNLVTALSKRLGIPIPEEDYPRFGSFDSASEYLADKAA